LWLGLRSFQNRVFGPGVFRTRVLETCVLETVEKKPKSLKGLGSTVRRVWLEGAISRGAKFVRKRTNKKRTKSEQEAGEEVDRVID